MKKIITFLFILSLLISNTCFSQSGWVTLNTGTQFRLNSIYFYNENTGYVIGDSGMLGGVDLIGIIIKTTNGGLNWSKSIVNIGLFDIAFTGLDEGYIIGSEPFRSSFFKTSNGGNNWSETSLPCCAASFSFADQYTVYVVGGQLTLKSTNAGINWTTLSSGNNYFQSDVFFCDSLTGYIVGAQSLNVAVALKTLNGGINWSNNLVHTGKIFNSVYFTNLLTGYIVGGVQYSSQPSGVILKTTNAGANWNVKYDNIDSDLESVFMVNADIGYAAGDRNGFSVGNKVLKTTNGGETWLNQQIPVTWGLKSVFFINTETGYVCGYHGTLLKTTNGGITGFKNPDETIPDRFSLSQNYPNPFNPVTRIKYDVPKSSFVKIIIYDVLGREIEILVSQTQKPGSYEVTWDGSGYASGVYFYKLMTDEYTETKKMVLIK